MKRKFGDITRKCLKENWDFQGICEEANAVTQAEGSFQGKEISKTKDSSKPHLELGIEYLITGAEKKVSEE